jgi:arabinogalactan oligomer / maltooligosaccharide transport system permease protein
VIRAPRWYPYLLLAPAVAIMLVVVFLPLLYNVWLSFRNMSLAHFLDHRFVGFEQYGRVLEDPVLYVMLGKSLVWTAVNLLFHTLVGVSLALLLNGAIKGKALFRALLILPWAMPQYISALTWRGMFNAEYGAINLMLRQWLHLPGIPWQSDPFWAFVAPIVVNIWLGFPFIMVVTLGGLSAIPAQLYEAADLDGASWWQKFRNVTWPQLTPVLAPALILGTIWTFNNLNVIWLVSQGGQPGDRTHILVTYIYKVAFSYSRYSFAAAFSVIVLLLLLVFLLFSMKKIAPAEAR